MRRTAAVAVSIVISAALLSACGGGGASSTGPNGLQDKSAVDAFTEGANATVRASDVVAVGQIEVNGVLTSFTSRFGGTKADATVKPKTGSGYEVITDGGRIWVKADTEFWKNYVATDQANVIGERWAVSLADGSLSSFGYFVSRDSFLRASMQVKKGDEEVIRDQPTLQIIDPPTNTNSTWWFATTGEPVLMRYVTVNDGRVDFTYDAVVIVDLPPADQTVDVSDAKPRATPAPTKK